jgi:dolichol-phosphate mannosyltransferase
MKEMGSRYLFICLYVWLEKYFSRGDYRRESEEAEDAQRVQSRGAGSR